MTSQFDPQSFLDATLTEPTEKRNATPVGDYVGVIGEITSKTWSKADGSKTGIKLMAPITIEIPAEIQDKEKLPPTVTLFGDIMLDLTPEGLIDNGPGKNRALRMYREATDLNKPGDAFNARMLTGKVVKVKVSHELYQDQVQERIAGVVKA